MEALAKWLLRLTAADQHKVAEHIYRVFVPGRTPLDLNDWLIATDPGGEVPAGFRGSSPESLSLFRLLDEKRPDRPIQEHQRLVLELAAAMTLALGRRVEIPHEIAMTIEGEHRVLLAPYGQSIDTQILAPLPVEPRSSIERVLSLIGGLPEKDQTPIGAATTMYHGAILLFDREIRAAYTLLVGGIEVLSRFYGSPPMHWSEWNESPTWDKAFVQLELTEVQSAAMRQQLLADKQLRLKATFRAYASNRLRPTFWSRSWVEWWYDIDASAGQWNDGCAIRDGHVEDVLPKDRAGLARALGQSYDLRSGIVHQGSWTDPLNLTMPNGNQVDLDCPLPFAVLRAILSELIMTELEEQSAGVALPEIRLMRPE